MKTYTSDIFSDIRKFHGLTQIEMAEKLNVSQSAISKIESNVFVPELTLWFDLVRLFGILDPYCFYYGTVELKGIPDLSSANRTNWHGMWSAKNKGKLSMTVRSLSPLLRHLKTHSPSELKSLFKKYDAPVAVTSILNYPLPWDLVWDIFELGENCDKRFNLTTTAPHMADHGSLFKIVPRDSGRKGITEFLLANSPSYFGKIQLDRLDGKEFGVSSIPDDVRKTFVKYLTDFPQHLTKKPAFELTA